jgi:hypothetical protein
MNVYVGGALWVTGVAAVAAAGTTLVRRHTPTEGRSGNEAIGTVFALVGGLHAVVLAFVLISLYDTVSTARDGSYAEANNLVAVYWAGVAMPEPARGEIQDLARSYRRAVIDEEWPDMREGNTVTGPGSVLLDRLRTAINAAPAADDWQRDRRTDATNRLFALFQARQARLAAAEHNGVSAVVWIALIVGGILSISLAYLFDSPRLLTHIIMMASLAGTIALLLFAIYWLQNPFSTGALVAPDAFVSILDRFAVGPAG